VGTVNCPGQHNAPVAVERGRAGGQI